MEIKYEITVKDIDKNEVYFSIVTDEIGAKKRINLFKNLLTDYGYKNRIELIDAKEVSGGIIIKIQISYLRF